MKAVEDLPAETLVTNNTNEFGRVEGLALENWTLPRTARPRKARPLKTE